jgi:hypothetical protein
MVRWIRDQAEGCGELGSPLYLELLHHVADDVLAGGPAAVVLSGHENDPGPSALALRLMGGVHRLVLTGRAPGLAAYYPSVGGEPGDTSAWPALRSVLEEHLDELRSALLTPPQTNEVGRAAALIGGLHHVVARRPRPVRLLEIGASAGLNLRADRFRLDTADGPVGPPDSPVSLGSAWRGVIPPRDVRLEVVERLGCDPDPVDPTSAAGRLRLTSYVWPDQTERLARLRGAIAVAEQVPAEVRSSSAQDFLRSVRLEPGTTTVVWHSTMWQYLSADERARVTARLAELGEGVTPDTGLVELALEPTRRARDSRHRLLAVLRSWPGGGAQILAEAAPHGIPTVWEAAPAE